jgi:glucose dehydrogenase
VKDSYFEPLPACSTISRLKKFHPDKSGVRMKFVAIVLGALMAIAAAIPATPSSAAKTPDKEKSHDWPVYGGTPENNHFSSLKQINRKNVKRLQIAWTFDTEESGGLQTSPIVIDGILYGLTPSQKVFALDAATGKLLWKFDSGIRGTQPDRGLAYWSEGRNQNKSGRILVGVMNFVYALDVAVFGIGQPQDVHFDTRGNERDDRMHVLRNPGRGVEGDRRPDGVDLGLGDAV